MPAYHGDTVRIKSGPFSNFLGRIEGINQAKLLLKIAVEILGSTRIVLTVLDVEKVS